VPELARLIRFIDSMDKPQKKEKPRKDRWDKAEMIEKAFIAVAALIVIPIVVAKISEHAQRVITAQGTGKDYIDIALRIRERKDVPEDLQKNKGLGKWAVKLLNRYSREKLDNDTSQELINGEIRIPIGQNIGTSSGVATTAYMLVAFNRDKSLRASVDAEGFLEIMRMTTGLSTSGTFLPYHPGGNGFAIASPRVAMFSRDDKYLVIANDITFDILK
jgi:hypothetical protein